MPRLLRKHVVGQNLLFGFGMGFCLQRDQSLRLQKQTEMPVEMNDVGFMHLHTFLVMYDTQISMSKLYWFS